MVMSRGSCLKVDQVKRELRKRACTFVRASKGSKEVWTTPGGHKFIVQRRGISLANLMLINQALRTEGLGEIHQFGSTTRTTSDAVGPAESPIPINIPKKITGETKQAKRLVEVLRQRLLDARGRRRLGVRS